MSLRLHLWTFALRTGLQWPSTCALQLSSRPNSVPTVQCCSANQAHSRKLVTAATPLETCSSCRFAVAQHQCTAALFKAKCSPHCAMLVYKPGSLQEVCHCVYTCGDLLFIQVCSGPAPMHCSSLQGKMQSSLCSAGLQTRLTAGSVSLRLHLWRHALHTNLQWPSTSALQLSSRQNAVLTVQCWFTNQAHSRQCVTAVTPLDICSSYRFAMAQHLCTAALFKAKFSPHCSVLLCKPGSQQEVSHCSYTFGDLLFIQVCSGPAPVHCSSLQGKMQSSLCNAGLQTRLTPGSLSLRLHLWRFALHTGLQWPSTNALQLSSRQNAVLTVQCWFTNQAHSRQCVTAVTPVETRSSYKFAVAQHQCTAAVFKAKCSPHCAVLVYKPGSQQAVCHCGYTCGHLLFIQVCNGPAPVHCSSLQGQIQSPLFSAALQTRLTAGS